MKPLKKDATYDDLCDVPDHFVAEMFDGELYASPRPASPHARAASILGGKLGDLFDWGESGPGGWVILDEPELHFGGDGSDSPKPVAGGAKVGRNDPCPCGSGKKYKKCHGT